jgi:hypothetical protein
MEVHYYLTSGFTVVLDNPDAIWTYCFSYRLSNLFSNNVNMRSFFVAYLIDVSPQEYRGSFIALYNLAIGDVNFNEIVSPRRTNEKGELLIADTENNRIQIFALVK